ncbi:hypothetical protein N2152v2_004695 [Parachlorella kessleri]
MFEPGPVVQFLLCDVGATPATPASGLVATLHLQGQHNDFRESTVSKAGGSSRHEVLGGSVAVVLSKAWLLADPLQDQLHHQQHSSDDQVRPAAGIARRLQAASTCSLTVAGIAHTFDACPSVDYSNAPLQYFYSLSSDASGSSTVLRGGIKAQGVGWAGWGFGSNQMAGTDAVVVKTDTSSSTGASVAGYSLPRSTATSVVNAAKGTWPVTDAAASLDSDTLTAVFTVTLPGSVSTLASSPYRYIYATGSVSSSTGALREHDDYGPGSLTLTAPSPQPSPSPEAAGSPSPSVLSPSPAPSPSPSPLPSPSPTPTPDVVVPQPEASPSPSPATPGVAGVTNVSGVAQQSCMLASGSSQQQFAACTSLTAALGQPFNIMWQVLPGSGTGGSRRLSQAAAGTTQVRFGLNGTTDGQGYMAVGFPTTAGQMTNSNAFILQDCSSCTTGASILGYWLAGTDQADVNPPSHMVATNLTAARTTINGASWLSGSFVVELDSSQVSAASTPLIFAVGPLSRSGTPQEHDTYGTGDVNLASGSVGSMEAGGQSQALKDSHAAQLVRFALDPVLQAHAWLMTISWGVLIPSGIVVARCFKELDPLWFKLHRAVQSIGFLLGIVGFGLGFAIRGSWSTPYAVHRNLGVAVMVLGTAQVTALFARPLQSSPWRRYWNWNHCGIIHVDQLGAWAWATYTAVLAVIASVWLVKDSLDFFQGRRTLLGPGAKFATSASQVQLYGRGGGSSDAGSNHSELMKGSGPGSNGAEQFIGA